MAFSNLPHPELVEGRNGAFPAEEKSMTLYKAPLREYRFVLQELFDVGELAKLPGYAEATPDVFEAVLEEGAKIAEEVLFPLNRSGDEEGCTYENGTVRTPKGFKDAYALFRQGGWTALSADPDYGGQGLPHTLNFFVEEMVSSANMSFGMYPGLSSGAYSAIRRHGSAEQKRKFLPRLVDGTWSGTMCLTEPQCGTDLGQIRTKAEPTGNGAYKITGTKIFISAGEHDLTDNIVHLVLARITGGPPGIHGISLFIVPKYKVKEDGAVGPSNGVRCGSIEHKMGIKASATCVINFEEAEGFLVGEAHKGMRAMFTMMNAARLGVGLQGLALGETAYQTARQYSMDRLQGRALKGEQFPDKPADPIIVHPDVRRMLLTMRAYTEGARALAAWVSLALDRAERHPDADAREEADDFVSLMTPIIKAMLTDNAFAVTNLGVQILDRARPRRAPSRCGCPRGGRRFRLADDADHQGDADRQRLCRHQSRRADLRRPRLHPRMGHGAARARRAHHHALRRRQRHPSARPGRAQDAAAQWPPAAPLLPSCRRLSAPAHGEAGAAGIRAAGDEGLRPAAAGDGAGGTERHERSRRGGRRGERIPARLRPRRHRLSLGTHRRGEPDEARRRRRAVLSGQGGDGALLHGARAA